MTVYDIHTHIFPDKIASKGVANIGGYYGIPMQCDGKASTLDEIRLPNMKCCISSAALKEEIVEKEVKEDDFDENEELPENLKQIAAINQRTL